MKLLDGEDEIPVLAPDHVAVLDGEAAEEAGIQVFVVLRMRMAADEVADVHGLHRVVAESQRHHQVACITGMCNIQSFHSLSEFLCDVGAPNILPQYEELDPFLDDIRVVFLDESFCRTLVLLRQGNRAFLFPDPYLLQHSVRHDQFENALIPTMSHMHVNGLMLIGVKVEDKAEIFVNLWHNAGFSCFDAAKIHIPARLTKKFRGKMWEDDKTNERTQKIGCLTLMRKAQRMQSEITILP